MLEWNVRLFDHTEIPFASDKAAVIAAMSSEFDGCQVLGKIALCNGHFQVASPMFNAGPPHMNF